ncbi:hypothetical protein AAKU55_005726 [Oxalobacteraceae bacterium GrIS 1.11]
MWGHGGTIFRIAQALYAARMTEKEEQLGVGRHTRKINLRLPEPLRDEIVEASKASGRSLNTEILVRLEASVLDESATTLHLVKTQLGLIHFLANCVTELAALMTDEQRANQRVQVMLTLSKSLVEPLEDGKQ